jgi:maleylpyruvate isomerase
VERDPGGRTFVLGDVAEMRLREVEIHHVDLDAGYSSADWEPAFSALLVDAMAARPAPVTHAVLAPTDHDGRWSLGSGGPVVSGPVHALAWWVTGRPAGPELTSDSGAMPRVENW